MNCIVTAGPTYEPLDEVRRLTNFSTGRFGSLLANYLVEKGHHVTLLNGHYATYGGEQKAPVLQQFTTTHDLRQKLQALSARPFHAVFHAAAVSDFGFGHIFELQPDGKMLEVTSGKISTRRGKLYAELVPRPKIIRELRGWFPQASLVGWKYEVDGDRAAAIARSEEQIKDNKTDACVANGPAYGLGFGLVTGPGLSEHYTDLAEIFPALEQRALRRARQPDAKT